MSNVYDVINEVRSAKHMSLRALALLADIAPTTLASMMSRKPDVISASSLEKIAAVFGAKGHELLTLNPNPDLLNSFSPNAFDARVSVKVQDAEKEEIVRRAVNKTTKMEIFEDYIGHRVPQEKRSRQLSRLSDDNAIFRKSINVVLNKLNTQGLMEAMRRLLDIANDPNYIIIKEDTLCQEDEPPAAQDYNPENVPMDDGKPASKRE